MAVLLLGERRGRYAKAQQCLASILFFFLLGGMFLERFSFLSWWRLWEAGGPDFAESEHRGRLIGTCPFVSPRDRSAKYGIVLCSYIV